MMKRILTAFLTGVMVAATCVSGAAASENAMKCRASVILVKNRLKFPEY